ncbi:uncharacterized protein G2W53_004312 [Senna tora]|uniref:Uncharacterized protein n=1 Tax=Senna tora TaxID=362788 RepID=A0A834XCY8_9FABA|nr:uncharacterized protein G2W53_004312 [Senna tora]
MVGRRLGFGLREGGFRFLVGWVTGLEKGWRIGRDGGEVHGLKGGWFSFGEGWKGGWGLGFGLREGEWFGFGEGCEGGWVTVLVRKRDTVWWGFGCCERGKGMVLGWKRDTVWWGCYGGVAMEVEVVGKKKKRLERERGRFWGERRKKGF